MKKRIALLLLLAVIPLFAGCWNYREIESLSIVAGAGIDWDKEKEEYTLYVEVVKTSGGQEPQFKPEVIEIRGETVFDAVRNIINVSGKRLYWSHAQVLFLSEEAAKERLIDILDWFIRDAEPRYTADIYILKDTKFMDLFKADPTTEDILSHEIHSKGENESSLVKAPKVEIYQMVNMVSSENQAAYAPCVTVKSQEHDRKVTEISGTMVFKKDKLIGHLEPEETKYFLYAIDKAKGGLLVKQKIREKDAFISLEVFKNKTDVKPTYNDGVITMEIKTRTEAAIGENGSTVNYMEPSNSAVLKAEMEKQLEDGIKKVIKKVQEEYGADIFGFAALLNNAMPEIWNQVKDKWDEEFKKIQVKVKSEIVLRNSGQSIRSLEVGE